MGVRVICTETERPWGIEVEVQACPMDGEVHKCVQEVRCCPYFIWSNSNFLLCNSDVHDTQIPEAL